MEAQSADQPDERIELLAYHAYQGEVWDKAFAFLQRAGLKAMDRAAVREAVGHFEQALAAGACLPDSRELLERSIDLRFELRSVGLLLGTGSRSQREVNAPADAEEDHRAGRHAHAGFAGARSSTAAVVAEAVLGVEGEVGVPRTVFLGDLRVVARALVDVVDDDGDLFITGRVDDMIISGGENIMPVEIESVLSLHEAVSEVAVVGLSDERLGQKVVAFIKAGETVSAETLDQYCRASALADFKRPRDYVFVREIPKSPVGKILRRMLIAGDYERA